LCMAYSGRCLLSGYINKRDPNQGTCTNSCRWKYDVHPAKQNENGDIVAVAPEVVNQVEPTLGIGEPTNEVVMLQEPGRPGEYMPAYEDEHGTYIMNSKDLRAIEHIERLSKMGIHSVKIEGRTKSFYYVARTAQLYRQAIDDAADGKPFDASLMSTLENLAHRGYTEGFLRRHKHSEHQNYEYGHSVSHKQQFVGDIQGRCDKTGLVEVAVKNKFLVGNSLEIMTTKGNVTFVLDHIQNAKGESLPAALGSGHTVYIDLPEDIELDKAILMRNLQGSENTRNPHKK